MATTVGVNEVASFCQISPRRVQQLVKEGMPSVGRGEYVLAACAQWYIGYLQSKLKDQGSGTSNNELKDNRIKYLSLQAQNAEVDLRIKRGELIEKEHTQVAINEAMVIIATQMDGLGGRCAGILSGMTEASEIRLFLLNETRRIRQAAANRLSSLGTIEISGRDPETATKQNTGRVGKRQPNTATGKRRTGSVAKPKNPVHDSVSSRNKKPAVQNNSRRPFKPNGKNRQHS